MFRRIRGLFGPSKKQLREEIATWKARNGNLSAEVDRLVGVVTNPEILDIGIEDGGLNMDLKVPHWATRAMAASFADTLGDAENWSTMQIGPMPSDKGMILVTIQKMSGESPVETVGKLREAVENFEAKVGTLEKNWDEAEQRYCNMLDQRDDARREAKKAIEVADLREMGARKKIREAQQACEEFRKKNKSYSVTIAEYVVESERLRTQLRMDTARLVEEAAEANMKLLLRNRDIDELKAKNSVLAQNNNANFNLKEKYREQTLTLEQLLGCRNKEIDELKDQLSRVVRLH